MLWGAKTLNGAIWEAKSAIGRAKVRFWTSFWYQNEDVGLPWVVMGLTLEVLGLTLEVKNEVWKRPRDGSEKQRILCLKKFFRVPRL